MKNGTIMNRKQEKGGNPHCRPFLSFNDIRSLSACLEMLCFRLSSSARNPTPEARCPQALAPAS